MFPKKKRIVDKTLVEMVRSMRCAACGKRPSDPHHVTTRGAGGDDTPENLMPLCHQHHVEWHLSPAKAIVTYAGIREWLLKMERNDILERVER